MELTKLQVSVDGDFTKFGSVKNKLLQCIESTTVPWKRPNVTLSDQIFLPVEFVQFTPQHIPDQNSSFKLFNKYAIFHIYWLTSSEAGEYHRVDREKVSHWSLTLRNSSISNWLIVFDHSKAEFRNRTLVLERLRTDFAKYQERLIEFNGQDVSGIFNHLRRVVISSADELIAEYNRFLQFEREQCLGNTWNFCSYVDIHLVLVELYYGFELFEDAIVLTRELYNFLTILVQNALQRLEAFKSAEAICPAWLRTSLSTTCAQCPTFTDILVDIADWRTRLRSASLSYLELRHFLFAHQIFALLALCRKKAGGVDVRLPMSKEVNGVKQQQGDSLLGCIRWGLKNGDLKDDRIVAQAKEFGRGALSILIIHSDTLKTELKSLSRLETVANCRLKLTVTMVIACYEITDICRDLCDLTLCASGYDVCSVWWQVCSELEYVETTCFNQPDELSSDVCRNFTKGKSAVLAVMRIHTALQSHGNFTNHLVAIFEQVFAVLKHFNWARHALALARRLADFYVRRDEARSAVQRYQQLLDSYASDGWELLHMSLLKEVIDVFEHPTAGLPALQRFVEYCLFLASENATLRLSTPERIEFLERFKRSCATLDSATTNLVLYAMPCFRLNEIRFSQMDDDVVSSPQAASCCSFAKSLHVSGTSERFRLRLNLLSALPGTLDVEKIKVCFVSHRDFLASRHRISFKLAVDAPGEVVGVACHMVPKGTAADKLTPRRQSISSVESNELCPDIRVTCKDLVGCEVEDVRLGVDRPNFCVDLVATVTTNTSIKLAVDHVHIIVNSCLSLVYTTNVGNTAAVRVMCEPASVKLVPVSDILIAGVHQYFDIFVSAGTERRLPSTLVLFCDELEIEEASTSIDIPALDINGCYSRRIFLICPLTDPTDVAISQQCLIRCQWLERSFSFDVEFRTPFLLKFALSGSVALKFLTVFLTPLVDSLTVQEPRLTAQPQCDTELLNDGSVLCLTQNQPNCFVWQVGNCPETVHMDLSFNYRIGSTNNNGGGTAGSSGPGGDECSHFGRTIWFEQSECRYEVSCQVEPLQGGVCRLHTLCRMCVEVRSTVPVNSSMVMMVQIVPSADDNVVWQVENNVLDLRFDVDRIARCETVAIPQQVGYLPLPAIRLFKRLPTPPENCDVSLDCSEYLKNLVEMPSTQCYNGSAAKQVHVLQMLKKIPSSSTSNTGTKSKTSSNSSPKSVSVVSA